MDLLVLAEVDGVVDMTPEAISGRTRIPLRTVLEFLGELSRPDPRSRTTAHEGRRIVLLEDTRDWGWQIVNYAMYRRIASDEQRREKTAARTQKYRAKLQQKTPCDAPVTPRDACDAMQKQSAEAEEKAETHKEEYYPEVVWNAKTQPGYQGAREVLVYFNHRLGKNYREVGASLDPIADRIMEGGIDVGSLKVMIDRQIACWRGTEFERHLTIKTLFSDPVKFNEYWTARAEPVIRHGSNGKIETKSLAEKELERELRKYNQ
jgi:uncharacterized phage protein (TIGR02220 family)